MTQRLVERNRIEVKTRILELKRTILRSTPFGLCFMLSLWTLFLIPDRYRAEVNFRSRALSTSGIVTQEKQEQSCYGTGGFGVSCTTRCNIQVEFKTHEGVMHFWDYCYQSAKKNQTVPVLYDPEQIFKSRIDRGESPESQAKTQLIAGLVGGIVSFMLLLLVTESDRKASNKFGNRPDNI